VNRSVSVLLPFFLLPAVLLLVLHALSFHYTVDDAFISFRYARNLVNGEGLVFNPGERVEGYTNFLWVMVDALGLERGDDPPIRTARIAGLAAAAGIILLLGFRAGRDRRPETSREWIGRLLPPYLLAASAAFALWAQAGLETDLFTLFVTAGTLDLAGEASGGRSHAVRAGILFGLASLTRPEGLLFLGLALGGRLLAGGGWGRLVPTAVAAAVLAIPYHAWRVFYYGSWLPNTFHAKTGGGLAAAWRGVRYLGDGGLTFGILPFLVPLLLLVRGGRRAHVVPATVILGYLLYVVAVGGDGLAMFRFLVPVLPLIFLLGGEAVAAMPGRFFGRVAAALLLVLLTFRPTLGSAARRFVEEDRLRVDRQWTNIGKWLGEYARPGDTVAVTTAGAIPYFSGLRAIDMLGITDPHIARRHMPEMGRGIAGHEKYDVEYLLDQRPEYILHFEFVLNRPVLDRAQFVTPWNRGLEDLFDSPRFHQLYEPRSVQLGPSAFFTFFALRPEYGGPPAPAPGG
jgi:arabinofuranosyltransferase